VDKGEYLKNLFLIIVFLGVLNSGICAQFDYMSLHQQSLVVDTHTDALLQVLRGADISKRLESGHVDLIRLKEGGVDVQFFAIWPNPSLYGKGGMFNQSIRVIDILDNILKNNTDKISLTRTPAEIEESLRNGKIAAWIMG
jgi:membrane dipeptidase